MLAALLAVLAIPSHPAAEDCNRNGVEDSRDLESGLSRDCNRNGVPDECDVLPVNLGFRAGPRLFSGSRTAAMAAADLDGDGRTDLAALDPVAGEAMVQRGDAAGGFAPVEKYRASAGVTFLAAEDLDGDARPDLAAAGPAEVVVLLNDAGRGFLAPAATSLTEEIVDLAPGDLDGDGDVDLAVVRRLSPSIGSPSETGILFNDGSGAFPSIRWLDAGTSAAFPAIADFDGDGDLDLVTGNEWAGMLTLLRGDGAGSFAREDYRLPDIPEGPYPRDLHPGDLDGDGDVDLAVFHNQVVATVHLNDGSGKFTLAGRFETGIGYGHFHTVLADLDGDRDLDIAASGGIGPVNLLLATLLNDGTGAFRRGPLRRQGSTGQLLAADVDGDGRSDLAVSSGYGIDLLWIRLMALSGDCDQDGVPDECGQDCNGNGVADSCELAGGESDCDGDAILDRCEPDCNRNGSADDCDIAAGASLDLDGDRVPDECRAALDCDADGLPDLRAIREGSAADCNRNAVPDSCDLAPRFALPAEEHFGAGDDVLLADLDGDGFLDLVALGGSRGLRVLLADRRGGYVPAGEYGSIDAAAAAAADLDGDGHPDLAVVGAADSRREGRLAILLNEGGGSFRRGPSNLLAGFRPLSVAVLDLERDGLPDLAVGSEEGVRLFRNRGGGVFERGEEVDGGGGRLAAADLNGDGVTDLATDQGAVLLSRGDGSFERGTHPALVAGVAAADLDGDGDLDLFSSAGWVGINAGDGTFADGRPLPGAGDYHDGGRGLAAGDLDGDLDVDVLHIQSGLATILRNRGAGAFEIAGAIRAGHGQTALALGDLEGDGDLDLAVASADSGSVSIHRNRGNGSLDARLVFDVVDWGDWRSGAGVDLDRDGDVDLLSGRSAAPGGAGALVLVENLGGGRFRRKPGIPVDWEPAFIAAADLDGDRVPEIVGTDGASGWVRILTVQGELREFPAGGIPRRFAPADLDGDGDTDLALALEDSSLSILGNTGRGSFDAPVLIPLPSAPEDVLPVDLDGDRDLDLVAGGGLDPGDLSLLFNSGKGAFEERREVPLDVLVASIAGGDLDGDGDADLLVGAVQLRGCAPPWGCEGNGLILVLGNDGKGSFDLLEAHPVPRTPTALAVADLDGDGDLDLAGCRGSILITDYVEPGSEIEVLLNLGGGRLVRAARLSVGVEPGVIVAANLVGDGLPDLAVFSPPSISILLNRTRSRSRDRDLDGVPDECRPAVFRRGDAHPDGQLDITDALAIPEFLFLGAAAPSCLEAADANGDGSIDISDAVFILGHLFLGGPPPTAPGPPPGPCGADPDPPGSAGDLGCVSYDRC